MRASDLGSVSVVAECDKKLRRDESRSEATQVEKVSSRRNGCRRLNIETLGDSSHKGLLGVVGAAYLAGRHQPLAHRVVGPNKLNNGLRRRLSHQVEEPVNRHLSRQTEVVNHRQPGRKYRSRTPM